MEFSSSESERSESESDWSNGDQEASHVQLNSKEREKTPRSNYGSGDGAGTWKSTPLHESNLTSLETKSSGNDGDVSALLLSPLSRDLENCEPLKNSGNSKEPLSSTVAKNSYKQGSQGIIIPEVLTEPLKKSKEESGNKEGGDSRCSSGYSSGLEEDAMPPQQSPTNPATKMDDVTPVSSKAKKTSYLSKFFQEEQERKTASQHVDKLSRL